MASRKPAAKVKSRTAYAVVNEQGVIHLTELYATARSARYWASLYQKCTVARVEIRILPIPKPKRRKRT